MIEWLGRILADNSRIVFVGAHIGALVVPIALSTCWCLDTEGFKVHAMRGAAATLGKTG